MINVNHKYEIVSEATQSVHRWHRNNEREQIIDNSIQKPIEQCFLGHVLDRLEFVIDVKLWSHLDETEYVDGAHQRVQNKRIRRLMLFVSEAVNSVNAQTRVHSHRHVLHGLPIVDLGFRLRIRLFISQTEVGERLRFLEFTRLEQLPCIYHYADHMRNGNQLARFIVEQVEHDD